jgi:hypothetical protein
MVTFSTVSSRLLGSFLLFSVVALSCGGGGVARKPDASKSPSIRNWDEMNESFDPNSLNDYDIEIPEQTSSASNVDVTFDAPQDSVGEGYRIQVVQTEDTAMAKDIQRDAILAFSEYEVYYDFKPPFYKVRVGDFVNWNDAEKLQQLAVRKGFKDAWIVPTKVDLTKAYQVEF